MLIDVIWKDHKRDVAFIVVAIAALAFAPRFVSISWLLTLITVLMYATLALAWTMFSGPTRYVSLATAALFGVGVYSSAVIGDSLPLWVIAAIGGLLAFGLAFLIGVLTLRLRGVYFILFTFGVTALIRSLVQWWETSISGTVGRHVPSSSNETVFWYALAIFALTLVASFLLRHSNLGKALEGIGENEDAARHIGIRVTTVKVLTFAASAVFMGAMGGVMAVRWRYIDTGIAFNPLISFLPVLMALFGGVARLIGPILGALVFIILQEFLITEYPYWYMLLFGLTLVVVVVWLPGGLVSLGLRWYGRIKLEWAKLKMRLRAVRAR